MLSFCFTLSLRVWLISRSLRISSSCESKEYFKLLARAFFKNSSVGGGGGWHLQKGTILYRVWRNDRWFVGNKKFGVVSHLIVGGGGGSGGILPQKMFVFFYPYDCNSLHFLKQIFGYTALHYAVDRLNLRLCTCIVCLCRYHNLVTQGTSLINLEGPTPTKRHHCWHRAGKFCVSKSLEMAFPKSSLPLLLGPFINSFIMICESMLSASQDGLLREMLLSKYRLQIFDYIYIRFQVLLVSKSIGVFWWGGGIIPPLIKHWVGGLLPPNLFSRAFQQLKSIGSRKCNPLENV